MRVAACFLALSLVATAACGPPFQTRIRDALILNSRVVAVPVMLQTSQLDATDKLVPQPEVTAMLTPHIDGEIARLMRLYGAHTLSKENVADQTESYEALRRWSARALLEIAAQETGRLNFGRHSVGDWRFPDGSPDWASSLEADFLLLTLVSDTSETNGRALLSVVGGMSTHWKQVGTACILRISDARVVACSVFVDRWPHLRIPLGAQRATYELVTSLVETL